MITRMSLQGVHCISVYRLEIFEVHTRSVRESGLLEDDVNLVELAANTSHFSGAEIAGVVREAVSFSLERKVGDYAYIQVKLCW